MTTMHEAPSNASQTSSRRRRGPAAAQADLSESAYFGEESATLGDRIAAARQSAGLTQAGLAARMGVGVKVISGWENDRSEPRANRLSTLSGLLNVSVAWLLTGRGEGVAPPAEREAAAPPNPCFVEIEVSDLAAAQHFYADLLSCPVDGGGDAALRFDFFGLRLTARLSAEVDAAQPRPGAALLGVWLDWDAWTALIERLRALSAPFAHEPTITQVGAPEEEGIFQLIDPSGVRLSFRARRRVETSPW